MVRRVDDNPNPELPADFDPDGSTLEPRSLADARAAVPDGVIDRDERLGEAIEAYLEQAEAGVPPDPETFAASYPDLGDDLLAALEGLALVKGLVGGPGGPGHRLEEGRRVAGYRIVRELGRGGMGVVYEAVHVGLDRPVALKVLGSQAAPDSSGRRRFLNEAKTAAGLHHTHIVPVFDVGQVGGLCYYAMQRIEGSGLDRVLRALRRDRTVASGSTHGSSLRPAKGNTNPKAADPTAPTGSILGDETLSWGGDRPGGGSRSQRWTQDADTDDGPVFAPPRGSSYYRWVADVGQQAAEALAHAHQRGIIHRDIKPSNLLVDARGVIWVADFGLARRLADPSQTQVDSLLGTPRYMSPEQARTGAIDGRADVYSLGATLYELITLRPPFDGQTAAELIDQIAGREPPRPRKFDARVPLDLETILLKALAKRPVDRYAGASELADDLGRFLAHEPVKARRIGPVGRTWRFARRHPGASVVSVLAASLVLTTATIAYVRIVQEKNRTNDQARQTDAANRDLKIVNAQLQTEVLKGLENQANIIQLSPATNRRSVGLDLVRQAASHAQQMKSDESLRVRLRDQALAFLSLRDVVTKPPIATDGPRHGLVFGPNSQRITALTADGKLSIWDVARQSLIDTSRHPIAPPRRDPFLQPNRGPGRFQGVVGGERSALAADGLYVIQPDGGGVRLFDLAAPDDPHADFSFPIKGQRISAILAPRDGRRFLTVGRVLSGDTGTGTGTGPNTGPEPHPEERPGSTSAPQNRSDDRPDWRSDYDDHRICLWDRDHPEAPRATLTITAPRSENLFRSGWFLILAIAPDGSRIAAIRTGEPEVLLWNGDGEPLEPITLARNATALTLGPAGMMAVAGNNGEVALWDLSELPPQQMPGIDLRLSPIFALRFDPRNGSTLAAGFNDGVKLYDLATHMPIAELTTSRPVDDLAFAPDGRTLAVGQSSGPKGQASSIDLWSVVEPTGQYSLPESGNSPMTLAFGPDDVLAITSRMANSAFAPLQLWGGPGQCPPSIVSWPNVHPLAVGFDGAGQMVVPDADAVRWFELPGDHPVRELALPQVDHRPGPRPPWLGVRASDGSFLLVSRGANTSFLWQPGEPDLLKRLKLPERGGFARGANLALAPRASTLYYLAQQGEALIARSIDAQGVQGVLWSVPVAQASSISLSPDGLTLAVLGSHSDKIQLRNAADGSFRATLDEPLGDTTGVDSIAFSPDSRTLAAGGREQVRLWAIDATPRPLIRLPGHRGVVRTLAFDAKGVRLAGADDKTIKVWDLARLRQELNRLGLDW